VTHRIRSSAICAVMALVLAVLALPATAQNKQAEQAIKYRQAAYTVLGTNFGIAAAMATGKMPYDAKAFQTRVDRTAYMATIVPETFGPGTDAGAPTKAKKEIWSNQAEFQKLMKDMQDKTAALAVAAKTNDLEKIKPAFGAAGQSCKACHDKYKAD
jgi:cytochrome c556